MCMTPILLKKDERYVPCGKCPECKARRISAWSFRLMEEEKKSLSAHFITLTYANEKVPITQSGFMSLRKRDVQLFIKRLRKAHVGRYAGKRIKYYLAGEYGSRTYRPHYHIILFNAEGSLVEKNWGLGTVQIGTVTGASVGYTLKYICKEKKIPIHKNDDRQPEFSLMSKGLGISYLTADMAEWHLADLENRMYCNVDGKKKLQCQDTIRRNYIMRTKKRGLQIIMNS